MPLSAERLRLGDRHRAAQVALTEAALDDWLQIISALPAERLPQEFARVVPPAIVLVNRTRPRGSGLAARYYRQVRRMAGLSALQDIPAAGAAAEDLLTTSLYVTGPRAYETSLRNGKDPAEAAARARTATTGALRRHILDASRSTITDAVQSDRQAAGWQRVTTSKPCPFCAMIAGRGAVFKESTAFFQAHDDCKCSAEPFFRADGPSAPRERNQQYRDLYRSTVKQFPDEDPIKAFRRTYRDAFQT